MKSPVPLVCPMDGSALSPDSNGGYTSTAGRYYPAAGGIPRFIAGEDYAAAFGAQWKRFQLTQLDSYTGTSLSRDRLARVAGGDLGIFRDRRVLEVGCGAGRFTEVLLEAGANLFATDLSSAVEANHQNFEGRAGYFVCQADLRKLPVQPGQFDFVICLGVIQHTPSPEETIRRLASYVAPGGLLLIDHYRDDYPDSWARRVLRSHLLKHDAAYTLPYCDRLCRRLWPVHQLAYRLRKAPGLWRLGYWLEKVSPVADYQSSRPELGEKLLFEWAVLDTHDALTDRYKHTRTVEALEQVLREIPLDNVECWRGGNGVECRASKPVQNQEPPP